MHPPSYLTRIRAAQPFRSRSYTRLADYLLDGFVEAAFMTAAQLAHATNVDVGTVVRFAQHLGYRGYPELQAEIQAHVRGLLTAARTDDRTPFHTSLTTLAQALWNGAQRIPPEQVRAWARMLGSARRVVLVRRPSLAAPARRLHAALVERGVPVLTVNPDRLLAGQPTLQPGDLLLALESRTQDAALQEVLARARAHGVQTALIGLRAASPAALQADAVLCAHAPDEHPAASLLVTALTLALVETLTALSPEVSHETDPLSAT